MKISIAIGDLRGSAELGGIIEQLRTAADHEFSTAWSSQTLDWDALTTLAVAGSQVSGIQLGTAVVPIPQRHPLVLASQALSVQAATGNRLSLGIGAGIGVMVDTMFGLPADRPARRMREYLTVLKPLLRGESVDHRGELLRASGAVNVPGSAAPDVLIAALGPAMLRLAGELADGTITWMTGPRTLAEHIMPTITSAAAGPSAPRVVAGFLTSVTADEAGVRDRVAEQFAMAGQTPEYRAMLDREGAQGPGDLVLAGDEDDVLRQLDRLRAVGVTEFMAVPYGTEEEQHRTIELLGAAATDRYEAKS